MSVICSAPSAIPAASSGIQTRSGAPAAAKHASSNVLLVKGAAECLLGRSTHVGAPPLAASSMPLLTGLNGVAIQPLRTKIDCTQHWEWTVPAALYISCSLSSSTDWNALMHAQVLLADGRTAPLTAAAKKKIMAEVDTMAASALRCLAFALKTDLPAFASYDGSLSHPVCLPSQLCVVTSGTHSPKACSLQKRTSYASHARMEFRWSQAFYSIPDVVSCSMQIQDCMKL